MASFEDCEPRVMFPCDLPNWPAIKEKLQGLSELTSPTRLVSQLQALQQLIPIDESPWTGSVRRSNTLKGLGRFLLEEATDEERNAFFNKTLPCMVHWAIEIEALRPPEGLPYSRQQCFGETVLSRSLAASIVACAFLCIFPYRPTNKQCILNSINFSNFFCHLGNSPQQAKLRCIFHYFDRLADMPQGPLGSIIFTRKGLKQEDTPLLEDWLSTKDPLCSIHVHQTGVIEEAGSKVIQVDFANRKLGGGVLGTGRVQVISCGLSPEYSGKLGMIKDGNNLDRAVFDVGQILAKLDHKMSKSQRVDCEPIWSHLLQQIINMVFPWGVSYIASRQRNDVKQNHALTILGNEEIRFCLSPELLSGMLFMECMDDNEAIWVQGFETFSKTAGYARTLQFAGNNHDLAQRDRHGNLENTLCAMDALPKASKRQFYEQCVLRELNKSLAGFAPRPRRHRFEKQRRLKKQANVEGDKVNREESMTGEAVGEHVFSQALREAWQGLRGSYLRHSSSSESYHSSRHLYTRSDSEASNYDNHNHSFDADRLFGSRRRSSNMSEGSKRSSGDSSRRSSDNSRRTSSSSTRHSSDFSSEFEDYFESFQRQETRRRHDAITEEPGQPVVQEFACGMVADIIKESTMIASQIPSGPREFVSAQPSHLTRPTPVKPDSPPLDISDSTSEESMSSNQTDDQKIKDNITVYVEHLLSTAFQTVNPPEEPGTPSLSSSMSSTNGDLRLVMTPQRFAYLGGNRSRSRSFDTGMIDLASQRIVQTAFADFIGSSQGTSPALCKHNGESLTDDLKQAVYRDSRRRSLPILNTRVRVRPYSTIEQFAHCFSDFILQQALLECRVRRGLPGARQMTAARTPTRTVELAEGLVTDSIQSAVQELFGYKEVHVPFSPVRDTKKGRASRSRKSDTFMLKRKGSADDVLYQGGSRSSRRNSLDELNHSLRPSSSGFHDSVLSSFEDELVRSNPNSPSFSMFDQRSVGSQGSSRMDLSFRRGSTSSRTSSSDRSPNRAFSRRDSLDVFLNTSRTSESEQSINLSHEKGTPASCKAVLLEFLSRNKPSDSNQTCGRRSPTHLHWYAEDLLLDAFNDCFVFLYGEHYADFIRNILSEKSSATSGSSGFHKKVDSYVEALVAEVMRDGGMESVRRQRSPSFRKKRSKYYWASDYDSEGSEMGSSDEDVYQDALDVPYTLLDAIAVKMTSSVMMEALGNLRELDSPVHLRSQQQLRAAAAKSMHTPAGSIKSLIGGPLGRPVATGNWGCGAFGGHPQLKLLIQWVSASVAGVSCLQYYTFGDERLKELDAFCDKVREKEWTSGELLSRILKTCYHIKEFDIKDPNVFQLVLNENL